MAREKVSVDQAEFYYGVTGDASYITESTVIKWGNSQGIRISRAIMEKMNMKINDKVEISLIDDTICIRKSYQKNSLQERLESFYNQPIGKIYVESSEVDWGTPEGDEIW